ncbi:hypothetical protein SAMN05877838_2827 [Hoeflea halophila]|uniref:Uncharacterized protein n=1 Tax=Hoeflea halophila TaxID=714899 RepID=A0A286ICX6_9HYPH|nr:hypothetical protein [Hoeflea halophila]SOE17922.1 hypothetical protein SAMN05877838_2827 [Hoeflea halophila]
MPAIHLSPEEISAHQHISRGEKLEWLNDMKLDLELQNRRGIVDPDRFDRLSASIEHAIARVTQQVSDRRRRRYRTEGTVPEHLSHI